MQVLFLSRVVVMAVVVNAVRVAADFHVRLEQFFNSGEYDRAFDLYKTFFNRTYKSAEEIARRQKLFRSNYENIQKNNELYANGTVSYRLKMNRFGDMSKVELVKQFMGYTANASQQSRESYVFYKPQGDVPESFDLRDLNLVTPVLDQETCAACWAFTAAGALETAAAIRSRKLVQLSPQDFVDCSGQTNGCKEGSMHRAFEYAQDNKGISSLETYPYESKQQKCKNLSVANATAVTSYTIIRKEEHMKDAVANVGAIAVALSGTPDSFAFYDKGVLDSDDCNAETLDHSAVVVGYGTEKGKDYWLVKNSWSTAWGIDGYVKIVRGKNMCGIATDMSFPNVE